MSATAAVALPGNSPQQSRHALLTELAQTVHRPVVTNDHDATTSERVRGETRVRTAHMPGINLALTTIQALSLRLEQQQQPLSHVVLLLPINYIGTHLALPSPLTDAMLFGKMMQAHADTAGSSRFQVFYYCNASAPQWREWVQYFVMNTTTELVLFCDCHGYSANPPHHPAVLLGYPRSAASGVSNPVTVRTRRVPLAAHDLITSLEIRDILSRRGGDDGHCRTVVVADCCHSAAVFGPAADSCRTNTWFVLGSEAGEAAHVRRVMGVFSYFCMAVLKSEPQITFFQLRERLNTVLPQYGQHAVVRGPELRSSYFFIADHDSVPTPVSSPPSCLQPSKHFTSLNTTPVSIDPPLLSIDPPPLYSSRSLKSKPTTVSDALHVGSRQTEAPDDDIHASLYVVRTGRHTNAAARLLCQSNAQPSLYEPRRHSLGISTSYVGAVGGATTTTVPSTSSAIAGMSCVSTSSSTSSVSSASSSSTSSTVSSSTSSTVSSSAEAAGSSSQSVGYLGERSITRSKPLVSPLSGGALPQLLYPQRVRRRHLKVDMHAHHDDQKNQSAVIPLIVGPTGDEHDTQKSDQDVHGC